jgi:IPT/TIG domain
MKTWLIAVLLISCAALVAFQGQPRCTAVDPDTAKTGDTVNVTCENVNKSTVADMYLTDGKDDTKIAVMEHTDDKIKFQVPRIKPGRYHIAVLTANKASMIEQPIALTVEE